MQKKSENIIDFDIGVPIEDATNANQWRGQDFLNVNLFITSDKCQH